MKKLKNLNLRQLGQAELSKREMNTLTGGGGICVCYEMPCACPCPCKYAGAQEGPNDSYYGGSSTTGNSNANQSISDAKIAGTLSQYNGDHGTHYGYPYYSV